MDLFELLRLVRAFREGIENRDWAAAVSAAGELLMLIGRFLGRPVVGVANADPTGSETELEAECERLRAIGAAPPTVGAEPSAITPGEIVVLVQLVLQVIDWFRRRRT
jgi:hypothetical protein